MDFKNVGLKEVTTDSLQEFINQHGNFMQGISYWIFSQADKCDADALNHFITLLTATMQEAAKRISEKTNEKQNFKTFKS